MRAPPLTPTPQLQGGGWYFFPETTAIEFLSGKKIVKNFTVHLDIFKNILVQKQENSYEIVKKKWKKMYFRGGKK